MDADRRRYETHLKYSGIYLIYFSFLDIFKFAVLFLFRRADYIRLYKVDHILEQLRYIQEAEPDIVIDLEGIVAGMFLLLLLVSLVTHLYIGMSAVRESRSRKTTILYLMIALVCLIAGAVSYLEMLTGSHANNNLIITSLFSDLTSYIAFSDILISAFRLRRLKRKNHAA